ncbi:MAG: hypothetical protein ACOZF0_19630 [Thermodesulfobacteriota bacterium]
MITEAVYRMLANWKLSIHELANIHPLNPVGRYDVKNIGYWVVYEQVGPYEWQCAYMAKNREDGERWMRMQIHPPY